VIDKFDGKPLNSPNDIVVKSDDSIWFTDRRSASSATTKATSRRPSCDNVYRPIRRPGSDRR
jgi:gluconolactonase